MNNSKAVRKKPFGSSETYWATPSGRCPWVFFYLGRRIGSHVKGWKRACIAADVPDLLFHDLRRSAVRNMERAGFPRAVALAISGHRTESVYRRYDIVSSQDLKMAAVKMEQYVEALNGQITAKTTTKTERPN